MSENSGENQQDDVLKGTSFKSTEELRKSYDELKLKSDRNQLLPEEILNKPLAELAREQLKNRG